MTRLLAMAGLLGIAACGGSECVSGPLCGNGGGDNPVPTTITLSSTSLTFSSVGETGQLTASVFDQNGGAMTGQTVTWSSSAPSVASVTPSGLVTATGNGSTTITASSGSASATASVSVSQVLASVEVTSPIDSVMAVGRTVQLAATGRDGNNNVMPGVTFTWSSSNPVVATVNGTGLVTGLSGGTTTVDAASGGQSGDYAIRAVPADLDGIQALLSEPFVLAMAGALGSTAQSALTAILTTCAGSITAGHVLAIESCLASALATSPNNGTDTALLGVLSLFFEESQRKLQLGR